jgi:predicted transcriptional regulator
LECLFQERKKKVILELYAQGKNVREIAKEAHVSFRDIGAILREASAEENKKETEDRPLSPAANAYRMFSEGKAPIDVAVSLNLEQPEASTLELMKLQCLKKVYDDLGKDLGPLLELYALCKSAGFDKKRITGLLKMADDSLKGFEYRYKLIKEEVENLEHRKMDLQMDIKNQVREIGALKKIQNFHRLNSSRESGKLSMLQNKRMRLENLVRRFEDNNEDYKRINHTVEEHLKRVLSDNKGLLWLALASLTESIRNQPEGFRNLFFASSAPSSLYYLKHTIRCYWLRPKSYTL